MLERKYGRKYVGKSFTNKKGDVVLVVDAGTHINKVLCEYQDEFKHRKELSVSHIKVGAFKNPMTVSVDGGGYIGYGIYDSKNKDHVKIHKIWSSMIERTINKGNNAAHKCYENVTVCKEWLNFNTYLKWYLDNCPGPDGTGEPWVVDKDIMQIGVENKIYSPEFCRFIHQDLNAFKTSLPANNTSGYLGVNYCPGKKKDTLPWLARIRFRKQWIELGRFAFAKEGGKAILSVRRGITKIFQDQYIALNREPDFIKNIGLLAECL